MDLIIIFKKICKKQGGIYMASPKPKINVVFIGHIDHGKSTTVGRLMFDTKNLSDQDYRKLQALAEEKEKEPLLSHT